MATINIPEHSDNATINLALDTIKINKQALVFVSTKRSAEKAAEDISRKIKTENNELKKLSDEVLKALSTPTKQCQRLARCIRNGIAFHHAGLVAKQRNLIEEKFKKSIIKIICATPTLSLGVDLPAYRSIVRDLRRYGRHGMAYIPVLEVHQMFGRAGRPNYDKEGQAICIAATEPEKNKIHEMYINGKPEEIESKLAVEPVLRTYLLSLIATDFVTTELEIEDFFKKTFWAYQFEDIERIKLIIDKILSLLEEWEFIRSNKDDFQDASELGNTKYKATFLGKRVAELYIDPLTAYFIINCLRKAEGIKVTAFSFLQILSHTLELRPLLRVKLKEYDKIQETLLKHGNTLLDRGPSMYDSEYDEFLASVKTSMMLNDWIEEKTEDFLMEEYGITPGELRSKLEIGNWLIYSAEEISRILQFRSTLKNLAKLRIRLKNGVREELIPLLKLKQIGRARARRMYFNGIRDIGDVRKADFTKLRQILGENIALNVKKQVGQEIKKVSAGKRKGQTGLGKY